MGKQWIYVLKSDDGQYFTGETTQLYTAFNQHLDKKESNVPKYEEATLIGLYNGIYNYHFLNYHKTVTDEFTNFFYNETILFDTFIPLLTHWINTTANDIPDNTFAQKILASQYSLLYDKVPDNDVDVSLHRPLCKCGKPAEVSINKKRQIEFKCALSNASWIEYKNPNFKIDGRCNFLEKYTKDVKLLNRYEDIERNQRCTQGISLLPPLPDKNLSDKDFIQDNPCIICHKDRYSPICYDQTFYQCCKHCLLFKSKPLKEFINGLTPV